jgi:phosphatidylglycerol:prolipoprotein diacylglycerol transferase
MSIDSYGIHIGFLYFRFYGLIIMGGAVMAALLARRLLLGEAQRVSGAALKKLAPGRRAWLENPDLVWDALLWVLGLGVIGARLYHIFTPSQSLLDAGIDTRYYLTHPLDILTTWRGGLGMPGAIIGGVLGLYIFARRNKLSFGFPLDLAAPGVALAQGIGRWGNFINQELYGPPTDLPWGIYIRPENRLKGFEAFERFHPLFLYESLWNLANAGFLLWIRSRFGDRLKEGDLFTIYLVTYALGRFLLEFIRIDFVPMAGINLNQGLMLLTALAAAAFLVIRHRRGPSQAAA